jgi:murein DD-endopeptidase MepM/ murein hydrolase activator NlpD
MQELVYMQKNINKLKKLFQVLEPELQNTSTYLSPHLRVNFPGIGGDSETKGIFKKYSREYYILKDFNVNLQYQLKVLKALNKYLMKRQAILKKTPSLWPIQKKGGYITSLYGERFDPITGRVGKHQGIDIACWPGEKVIATAPGTIVFAGWDGNYGRKIIIKHAYGFATAYAHNRRLLVRHGQKVKAGQVIAHAGNTGRSTGVHLHYEVHISGQTVDPHPFLLLNAY